MHFETDLEDIDVTTLVELSMDGPNWLFLDLLQKCCMKKELPASADLGPCNLHIVHSDFKIGAEATDWEIKKTLKRAFCLLHDTPACREDFTRVTGGTQFPLSFCATRWIEDRRFADRLIEILTQVVKIVDYWGGLGKKKRPSLKSYEHIKTCELADPLIIVKLHFFSYIAGLLESFLKLYQTDYPMIPFVFLDTIAILRTLFTIVVKPDVLEECNTDIKMIEIGLNKEKTAMKPKNIFMGVWYRN